MSPRTKKAEDPRIKHLRRAYFALCRELGLDEDTRHAFNGRMVGKVSTTKFGLRDWREVVAELQIQAGQPARPGRPLLRRRSGSDGGDMASLAQIATIEDMAEELGEMGYWQEGPEAFVRSRVLSDFRSLRWSGRWEDLFRHEASKTIIVFKELKKKVEKYGYGKAEEQTM